MYSYNYKLYIYSLYEEFLGNVLVRSGPIDTIKIHKVEK